MVTTPDIKLLQRFVKTGDPRAFSEIIRKYHGLVYSACYRVLGNRSDAEDAVQECFLNLSRQADSVRSSLGGWLHRCAVHVSINQLKSRQARSRRERSYGQSRMEYKSEREAWRDVAPRLDEALEQLPDELRFVVVEHYLRQRTQTEIASEMNVSPATLSRQVKAGVTALRRRLAGTGVAVSAGVLAGLLRTQTSTAAPVTLAATVEAAVLPSAVAPGSAVSAAAAQNVGRAAVHVASAGRIPVVKITMAAAAAIVVAVLLGLAGLEMSGTTWRNSGVRPAARVGAGEQYKAGGGRPSWDASWAQVRPDAPMGRREAAGGRLPRASREGMTREYRIYSEHSPRRRSSRSWQLSAPGMAGSGARQEGGGSDTAAPRRVRWRMASGQD